MLCAYPRATSGSKLLPRAEIGIFFGYTDTPSIYKILFSARKYTMTVKELDVSYSNSAPPAMSSLSLPGMPTLSTSQPLPSSSALPVPNLHSFVPSFSILTPPVNRYEYISFSSLSQPSSPSYSVTRSGQSMRSQVDDIHEAEVLVASAEIDNEPRFYKQAIKSPDMDKWQIAIQEELNTLYLNNT